MLSASVLLAHFQIILHAHTYQQRVGEIALHARCACAYLQVFACTNIPLVMEAVESCLVPPCNFSGIAPFAVENRQENTSKPSQQAVNKFDAFIANEYTEFREKERSLAEELQALGFQNKLYTIPRWHLGKHDDTPTTQQIVKKKPTTLTGKADPKCKTGLIVDYHNRGTVVCCPEECGVCGASDECQQWKDGKPCPCANRKGGADACCVSKIQGSHAMCAETGPPCVVSYNPERNNLADEPKQQEHKQQPVWQLIGDVNVTHLGPLLEPLLRSRDDAKSGIYPRLLENGTVCQMNLTEPFGPCLGADWHICRPGTRWTRDGKNWEDTCNEEGHFCMPGPLNPVVRYLFGVLV